MQRIKYRNLALAIAVNLTLLFPFIFIWTAIFVAVFLGISGILGGLFLIVSYLTTFWVNLVPINLYEHPLLLFSYALFFIGVGGLLLILMNTLVSWLLGLMKQYYQWNVTLLGGKDHEK